MDSKFYNIKWIITGNELDRIKKCEYKQKVYGPQTFVGSVPFYLGFYIKGCNKPNYAVILLYCDAFNQYISKLKIQYTISINEINYTRTQISIFQNFPTAWSIPNQITYNNVANLNAITVCVAFKVLNINDGVPRNLWNAYLSSGDMLQTDSMLEWNINDSDVRKCQFREAVYSRELNVGNIPFYVDIYPSGYNNVGFVNLCLGFDGDGLDILSMDIFYSIYLVELGYRHIDSKTIKSFPGNCVLLKDEAIKSYAMDSLDKLSIHIAVQIPCIKMRNGSVIPANVWDKTVIIDDEKNNGLYKYTETAKAIHIGRQMDLLMIENMKLKLNVNELKNDNESKDEMLNRNTKEMNEVKQNINSFREVTDVLFNSIKTLKEEIKNINQNNIALKQENIQMKQQLNDAINTHVKSLKKTGQNMGNHINILRQNNMELKQHVTILQQKANQNEAQMNAYNVDHNKLKHDLHTKIDHIHQNTHNNNNSLKHEIHNTRNEINIMRLSSINNMNYDICNILYPIKLMDYYHVFIDNGFETNDELKDLTKKDLIDMEICNETHQNQILNAIKCTIISNNN